MTDISIAQQPPSPSDRADLAAFLAGWFRAWQAGRLYGPGHPVVHDAAAQAAQAVAGLRQSKSVVVLPEGFMCGGEAIESDTVAEALKALSSALHAMDVSAIDLGPGLTADDAEASALAMAQASDQPVVERVNSASPGRLNLRAVTYRGVQVRDGARDTADTPLTDASTRARLWSRLNEGILDPESDAIDPRELARQISAQVSVDPQAAFSGLRDSLAGTARDLAQRPHDEQRQGIERIQTLLKGLGPELRLALERAADPRTRAPKPRPADDAMAGQILNAMARSERAGAELSSEAVMLCQKLANLSPASASSDVPDPNAPAQAMAEAIESLFSRFDSTHFTPEDYRQQIQQTLDATQPAEAYPGLDHAFAVDTLKVRCAHIAYDLLDSDGVKPSAALQEVIAASVLPLIDAGAFTVLSERLRCGDAVLTQALTRDVAIDRVLEADAANPSGSDHAVIIGLLHYAGDRVVKRATHRILTPPTDSSTGPLIGPAAQAALDSASPNTRCDALRHAMPHATGPLPIAAAPLLSGLPFNTATTLIKTQLNAKAVTDRHAAYALLEAAFSEWPARFLSQALRDSDPGVQRRVLDQLSTGIDARHLALAKLTLSGQSVAGLLGPESFDQLTRGTLARGIEGQWVAAQVLRHLARTLAPRRAALGVRLAEALTPHQDAPPVRRALKWWRLMPARWAARLAKPTQAQATQPIPGSASIPETQPATLSARSAPTQRKAA